MSSQPLLNTNTRLTNVTEDKETDWMQKLGFPFNSLNAVIMTLVITSRFSVLGGYNKDGAPTKMNETIFQCYSWANILSFFFILTSALFYVFTQFRMQEATSQLSSILARICKPSQPTMLTFALVFQILGLLAAIVSFSTAAFTFTTAAASAASRREISITVTVLALLSLVVLFPMFGLYIRLFGKIWKQHRIGESEGARRGGEFGVDGSGGEPEREESEGAHRGGESRGDCRGGEPEGEESE